MATKKTEDIKLRKKKWIQIISPVLNDRVIGETNVYDTKSAIGKVMKINMMNILGDPRKQNTEVLFQADQVKGETAVLASPIGYNIQQPALRKLVRRGKTKLQDSFKCMSMDNKPTVVKTFVISRSRVNRTLEAKIRKTVRRLVVNKMATMTFELFLSDVIAGKIQKEIKMVVDKIYPTKLLELYTIRMLNNTLGQFEKPQAEVPVKPEEVDEQEAETQDEETPSEEASPN